MLMIPEVDNIKKGPAEGTLEILYDRKLDNSNVNGIQAFLTILYFVGYAIIFTDLVAQTRNVNENVRTTISWCNETKTFGGIEEFYCTFLHFVKK